MYKRDFLQPRDFEVQRRKSESSNEYFIKLAYNGSLYHWQYQPNASSVQETMNKAISTLLNSEISIMGAGRTDTGVHARKCMPILILKSFDIPSLVHKLNSSTKRYCDL
jgi:tRNA pseudouridine38-40 synthase